MNKADMGHPTQYIHEHFEKGGSIQDFLLVIVGIVVLFGVLAVIHRMQRGPVQSSAPNSPAKLFKSIIQELGLTVRQRDVLGKIAFETGMRQPVAILLSPSIFDKQADKWLTMKSGSGGRGKNRTEQLVATLREEVFEDGPAE